MLFFCPNYSDVVEKYGLPRSGILFNVRSNRSLAAVYPILSEIR